MLTIRGDQMALFTSLRIDRFVEEAYEGVRRHWDQQVTTAGPDATRGRLRAIIHEAESHGFSTTEQVLRYINICYALGDNFPAQHSWAARLLAQPGLSPNVRISLLAEKTQDWLNGIDVD